MIKQWLSAFKERLLTRGTQLDLAELTENSDMHWAVIYDSPRRLEQLLEQESKLTHQRNRLGFTPHRLALLLGREECRKLLRPKELPPVIHYQERGASEPQRLLPDTFKERTGITWSSTLRFPDFETLLAVYLQVEESRKWRQLDSEALWLGTFHRRDIEMSREAAVTIKWINEELGYGVFSEKKLPAGAYIGEYGGVIHKKPWFVWHVSNYQFRYPTTYYGRTPYTIDAEFTGNATRFLNHSDKPNCEAIGVLSGPLIHIIFKTTREVAEDEELRFDYGPLFWKRRNLYLD